VAAYLDQLARADVTLGPDWDVALTAALASCVVARAQALDQSLEEDRTWGTTTIRPRALSWLRSFAHSAERSGALPRLGTLAEELYARLAERWPDAAMPDYPALARPGALLARAPDGWYTSD
jgi:hypothetical protein